MKPRLFGPSLASRISLRDAQIIYAFLRDEPVWPLLKAIWKARRDRNR